MGNALGESMQKLAALLLVITLFACSAPVPANGPATGAPGPAVEAPAAEATKEPDRAPGPAVEAPAAEATTEPDRAPGPAAEAPVAEATEAPAQDPSSDLPLVRVG